MKDKSLITSFLVKLSSRCNLDCDYCYVFHHADQSWKILPPIMSKETREALAYRIGEYVQKHRLKNCLVVFHGGEPLLLKIKDIIETVHLIRKAAGPNTQVDISLQTNGVLLTKEILELFQTEYIGVSLSLDGHREANDLHRLTKKGHSSFDRVLKAYHLLQEFPDIFMGVISVIDVRTSPRDLLHFFDNLSPPHLDFLLPDANYKSPPPFKDKYPLIYQKWLMEAFDIWSQEYPNLKIRLFDNLLKASIGFDSGTDFFGFGNVTMLTIETDGSFHDLDVFKITKEGHSYLNMDVYDHSIEEAGSSPLIAYHNSLLNFEGIADKCKQCSVVQICGGGAVPHRYSDNGFANPTVYCNEMFSLINHAKSYLNKMLGEDNGISVSNLYENEIDIELYNETLKINDSLSIVYKDWINANHQEMGQILATLKAEDRDYLEMYECYMHLDQQSQKDFSSWPSVQFWLKTAIVTKNKNEVYDFDGNPITLLPVSADGILNIIKLRQRKECIVHPLDPWLRLPFGSKILYEDVSIIPQAKELISKAFEVIEAYNPHLKEEIIQLSPVIVLIQDPLSPPDQFVSFSDNETPGALYICIRHKDSFATPYDIADAIIHEHRHQKLYLLERYAPVINSNFPYVFSPWKQEIRPVSGLFHAVFVFDELQRFWKYIAEHYTVMSEISQREIIKNRRMLEEALETLKTCSITPIGKKLLKKIHDNLLSKERGFYEETISCSVI